MHKQLSLRVQIASIPVGILLILTLYWSSLSGPFLFDDIPNLERLAQIGGVKDWHSLTVFLLGGHSAAGRPLSFASFLLDDFAWPSQPWLFRYHNLLFHVLTFLLLLWLTIRLNLQFYANRTTGFWIAFFAAFAWSIHPLMVSTTAYVVQRMEILSALFSIAGLLCYTIGRQRALDGSLRSGYSIATLGLGIFTILAFLSKENGALAPLLALVIEACVFRFRPPSGVSRSSHVIWIFVVLLGPLLLIAAYFIATWHSVISPLYETRSFTLTERLYTEPRIIVDYLRKLLLPSMQSSGLFHDDYPFSTSLLTPPSTIISIIAVAGLFIFGILLRRRQPTISLAILFFFAAHSLESTFLPLELYFEHRNYLASAFIFLPIVQFLGNG